MTGMQQLDGHVTEGGGMPSPRSPSAGRLIRELKESLTREHAGTMPKSPKNSKALRKAEVLGWETRNVSNHWLRPLSLNTRGTQNASLDQSGTLQQQLHPTYGPGQSTPQELGAIRATRMIQNLGRTAIYSDSPYMNNALESLVYAYCGDIMQPRRTTGHLPRLGSKAAAIDRAKRALSEFTPFRPEVPFADAVRVATVHDDRTALPALIETYIVNRPRQSGAILEQHCHVLAVQAPAMQLQAAALLVQHGFYFAAIKVVHTDAELLGATLEETSLILSQDLGGEEGQAAAWNWKESDRELFCQQFNRLRIIHYYRELRQLLHGKGSAALAHVEREMLFKVVQDFRMQLAAGSHASELPAGVQEENSSVCSASGRTTRTPRERKSAEQRYMPMPSSPHHKDADVPSPHKTKAARKESPAANPSRAAPSALQQHTGPVSTTPGSTTAAAKRSAAKPSKQAARKAASAVEAMEAHAEPSLATYLQPQVDLLPAPEAVPAETAEPVTAITTLQPEAGGTSPIVAAVEAAAEPDQAKMPAVVSAPDVDCAPSQQHATADGNQLDVGDGVAVPAPKVVLAVLDAGEHQTSPDAAAAVVSAEAPCELPQSDNADRASAQSVARVSANMAPAAVPEQPEHMSSGVQEQPACTGDAAGQTQEAAQQPDSTTPDAVMEQGTAAAEPGVQPADPEVPVLAERSSNAERDDPAVARTTPGATEAATAVHDLRVQDVATAEQPPTDAALADAALERSSSRVTAQHEPAHQEQGALTAAVPAADAEGSMQEDASLVIASDAPAAAAADAAAEQLPVADGAEPGADKEPVHAPAMQTPAPVEAPASPQPTHAASLSRQVSAQVASKPPSRANSSTRVTSHSRPSSQQGLKTAGTALQPSSKQGSRQASRQNSQRTTPVPAASTHDAAAVPLPAVAEVPADEAARAAVEQGLAELRRAGSAAREAAAEVAAAAVVAATGSPLGSRQSSTRGGTSNRVSGVMPDTHGDQLQVTAMFDEKGAADFEAQRTQLAAEMMEQQQQVLDQKLAQKLSDVAILEAAREQLSSARSSRTPPSGIGRPLTPQEQQVCAAMDEHISSVEARLQVEREALALLQEEKSRHEQEKRTLNEQLAKTMRLFQDQLSQTIKMAAMLQAQRIMTGGPATETPKLPQAPLPQEVDEPPTPEEIEEYGRYLGMDVEADADLLYIAEWALTAPVPEGWTVHLDQDGHEFFFNAATNKSCYEHPMDQHYKEYYSMKKMEKQQKANNGANLKPVRV